MSADDPRILAAVELLRAGPVHWCRLELGVPEALIRLGLAEQDGISWLKLVET